MILKDDARESILSDFYKKGNITCCLKNADFKPLYKFFNKNIKIDIKNIITNLFIVKKLKICYKNFVSKK